MKKIAIIPARSGSKGLKDKNILPLYGKPVIAWTIEAAIKSKQFDRVIVSTDSEKYKETCESYGAEVTMRQKELASDMATTFDVLKDLLTNRITDIDSYEYFALLQPTSPLRDYLDIINACDLFEAHIKDFHYLVSVTQASHAVDLVKQVNDGTMSEFDRDFSNYRRQSNEYYCPNGAVFIGKPKEYLLQKHFFGNKSLAFKMDKLHSIDIDDRIDFKLAEVVINELMRVGK